MLLAVAEVAGYAVLQAMKEVSHHTYSGLAFSQRDYYE